MLKETCYLPHTYVEAWYEKLLAREGRASKVVGFEFLLVERDQGLAAGVFGRAMGRGVEPLTRSRRSHAVCGRGWHSSLGF